MFYYEIKWKDYSAESLYVNQRQKDYIEDEWVKTPEQRVSQQFKLGEETYRYDSIERIIKSSKRIQDDTKLLYSTQAALNSKEPMVDGEGNIVTNWYKKLVSSREYGDYYSKHPAYITLERDDSGIWVGMRLAERENGDRPDTVELCNEDEVSRLWKSLNQNS